MAMDRRTKSLAQFTGPASFVQCCVANGRRFTLGRADGAGTGSKNKAALLLRPIKCVDAHTVNRKQELLAALIPKRKRKGTLEIPQKIYTANPVKPGHALRQRKVFKGKAFAFEEGSPPLHPKKISVQSQTHSCNSTRLL